MVRVGCQGVGRGRKDKEYSFDLDRERINRVTCKDGAKPKAGEKCEPDADEVIECGAGQPYVIEMLDIAAQKIQGLAAPPSLGKFTVTKEMMECMVDDRLQVHFEYGKRQ